MNTEIYNFKRYLQEIYNTDIKIYSKDVFISGGCLYNYIHNINEGDIDVFIPDEIFFTKIKYSLGCINTKTQYHSDNVIEHFYYKKFNLILPTKIRYWELFDYKHVCYRYDVYNDFLYINEEIFNLNNLGILSILNLQKNKNLRKKRFDKLKKKGFKPNFDPWIIKYG